MEQQTAKRNIVKLLTDFDSDLDSDFDSDEVSFFLIFRYIVSIKCQLWILKKEKPLPILKRKERKKERLHSMIMLFQSLA